MEPHRKFTRIVLIVAAIAVMLAALLIVLDRGASARSSKLLYVGRPVVAVVGDSFTASWTGTNPVTTTPVPWYERTADDLGWTVGNVVANPGAGFQKPGDFGTLAQSLRDHPIPSWTDIVLVQGGLNDTGYSPTNQAAAVADLLSVLRQQAPNATPVVIGMFIPGNQAMNLNRLNLARRMGDYAAIGNSHFIAVAPFLSFETSGDNTHPTSTGHIQIGDFVAWHISNNLGGNGQPFHLDPTGSFYVP
jgi:lysophospholipase L1-like esterase